MAFSLNNLFDLVNTDLLVIESPENLIFTKYRVLQLLQDNNQYLFKYEKISDLLMKTEPDSKSNYEKLLIDTNRFQINDEKKPIDLDILISEKSAP